MPKLRHIAIAAKDPEAMAEFYKQAFGFKEVGRPNSSLADGVFLSDGTLNLALLTFKTDQLGKGLDYNGIHHFGILVEDVAAFSKKLEGLGAEYYIDRNQQEPNAGYFEKKFYGPERVLFDIAEHPWAGCAPLDAAGETASAKLRHLAIAAKDPDAMAEFFKTAFGFSEVRRSDGPLAYGTHLSDGTIDLAILRFKTDQIGKGLDHTGPHHFGVLVDDIQVRGETVERLGGRHYMDQSDGRVGGFEVKMYGPEGVLFDVAEHPWTGSAALSAERAEAAE
ncbi:MAG TPA: VOC family protein [Stellaceae bacterium]|nr:VOC family protein [Stellaceae bacterium]